MSAEYQLPTWVEEMIVAMAAHVHRPDCSIEEAGRIGGLVGAVAATLYEARPSGESK